MNQEEFRRINQALSLAISHIEEKGFDDVLRPPAFLPPIEHAAIKAKPEGFKKIARSSTLSFLNQADLKTNRIGSTCHFLIMRDQFTFRKVCWLDPFDLVKYLTLAIILFEWIEPHRIAKEAGVIHSHRKSANPAELFDANFGYKSFRKASGDLTRARIGQWKVVTDISNFFDRIGNHALENHLGDIHCPQKYITLLTEILFQWAGDRRSFGLPVGSDASRIIAEAALLGVDRKMQELGFPFVRYVDDFRIFTATRAEAFDAMRSLSEILSDEGLSVNHKKTSIMQIRDDSDFLEEARPGLNDAHEVIDEAERIVVPVRVLVSGKSGVAKFYHEPGKEALAAIKNLKKADLINRLVSSRGHEQEENVKLVMKYFVYADQDTNLVTQILELKATSIFYVVDALIKEAGKIPAELKDDLREIVFTQMGGISCTYPYQIPMLRLFSTEGYTDSRIANGIVDKHRAIDNVLFFREAILLGFQQMDRKRIRALAIDVFPHSAIPIKRAIFHAFVNYARMSENEKRPIQRNMLQLTEDWFIVNHA